MPHCPERACVMVSWSPHGGIGLARLLPYHIHTAVRENKIGRSKHKTSSPFHLLCVHNPGLFRRIGCTPLLQREPGDEIRSLHTAKSNGPHPASNVLSNRQQGMAPGFLAKQEIVRTSLPPILPFNPRNGPNAASSLVSFLQHLCIYTAGTR
jgi:hypothetical protein